MTMTLEAPSRCFTQSEYTALSRAHSTLRLCAVRLAIATDYPNRPEVAEVYWPGGGGVRWLIYRDAGSVLLDEMNGRAASFSSVEAALQAVTSTVEEEQQATVEAIPATIEAH